MNRKSEGSVEQLEPAKGMREREKTHIHDTEPRNVMRCFMS